MKSAELVVFRETVLRTLAKERTKQHVAANRDYAARAALVDAELAKHGHRSKEYCLHRILAVLGQGHG